MKYQVKVLDKDLEVRIYVIDDCSSEDNAIYRAKLQYQFGSGKSVDLIREVTTKRLKQGLTKPLKGAIIKVQKRER